MRLVMRISLLSGLALLLSGTALAGDRIEISEDLIKAYNIAKLEKTHHFFIYTINDANRLVIEQEGERASPDEFYPHQEFVEAITAYPEQPRFAVIFFSFGDVKAKPLLVHWSPGDASIMQKALYTGARDTVVGALPGIEAAYLAKNTDDLDEETLLAWWKRQNPFGDMP